MPNHQHHLRDHGNGPKRPNGAWFAIILVLMVAYGVAHSSGSNSSARPVATGPASDLNSLADESATRSYSDYGSASQASDAASVPGDSGAESASSDDDESSVSDALDDATYWGGCSGDYYENSDGICVHRPVDVDEAPSGATAQCNDGTYSFSQHHSGTCSHHGGVSEWL
jgi:hypothetical protein